MIVIVQPWFSAVGHPAQSLLNLAKIMGNQSEIIYLISVMHDSLSVELAKRKLISFGRVLECKVKTPSVREGTLKTLTALKHLIISNNSIDRVFFLDAHLVLLSILWPLYRFDKIKRVGVVYLLGPERIASSSILKYLINRFLKRSEVMLFLRTDELVFDWKKAFPAACIKCLPSLEIPPEYEFVVDENLSSSIVRIGVLGQLRSGKSLEWLVPIFIKNPTLAKLTVAGGFSSPSERRKLAILEDFEGFEDKYLDEDVLLRLASEQDYLLMLYDEWDSRMEGAVMFLAARVNRPVIVYNKGWCGRMVETYGNGLYSPTDQNKFIDFVKNLPKFNSQEYKNLLRGVSKFKKAHSGNCIKLAFLDAINN